jgi:hypothetical protein
MLKGVKADFAELFLKADFAELFLKADFAELFLKADFAKLFSKAFATLFLKAYIIMLLIKSLIFLLCILFLYHFYHVLLKRFRPYNYNYIEGMTGSGYTDPGLNNNPTYLAITNASNISFLKGQVDDLLGLKQTVATLTTTVSDLNTKVENNSAGISALGQTLKNTSAQLTGRDSDSTEPLPQATGLNYGNMNGIQNSF